MKKLYAVLARLAAIAAFPVTMFILHNSRRVRVVILADQSILLQRTSMGVQKWSLPGGGVTNHENDQSAAVREVAEEVGLTINPEQLIYLGEDYRNESGRRFPKFTRVYFAVHLSAKTNPVVNRPFEILEAKWFPLSQLPAACEQTVAVALKLLQ